jgi:predicted AAA+ superfamily ATPase
MEYRQRIVDDELDVLVPGLPALALEGPKAVGKTATALRRAATVYRLDDPAILEIARADPSRLVTGARLVLVDEWQRLPTSWDTVRRAVDADSSPGQFLLTGSATPTGAATHSGAGRIATVRMRPLSLAERGLGTSTVTLAALLEGRRPTLYGATTVALADYAAEIVSSGFPAIRALSGRLGRTQLDGYLSRIVERDLEELGRPVRSPTALRRWMTAYAAATSTTASFEVIRDAASPGETDKPARSTTIPYRRVLEQLWIIEDVPAWLPTRNRLRRLGEAPRHQLADPALAARLLGVDVGALLDGAGPGPPVPRDGTLLGALFESLVTLSARVYAQANEATVRHLRTRGGEHEVDIIVERGDGRIVALEVKLARSVDDADVRHLHWLADRIGPDLLDAAVITTGPEAYRRADGIGVIPAALLGP